MEKILHQADNIFISADRVTISGRVFLFNNVSSANIVIIKVRLIPIEICTVIICLAIAYNLYASSVYDQKFMKAYGHIFLLLIYISIITPFITYPFYKLNIMTDYSMETLITSKNIRYITDIYDILSNAIAACSHEPVPEDRSLHRPIYDSSSDFTD